MANRVISPTTARMNVLTPYATAIAESGLIEED